MAKYSQAFSPVPHYSSLLTMSQSCHCSFPSLIWLNNIRERVWGWDSYSPNLYRPSVASSPGRTSTCKSLFWNTQQDPPSSQCGSVLISHCIPNFIGCVAGPQWCIQTQTHYTSTSHYCSPQHCSDHRWSSLQILGSWSDSLQAHTTLLFYLPVLVISSSTTRVRTMFDAYAKSTSGASLNNQLLIGPTIHSMLL